METVEPDVVVTGGARLPWWDIAMQTYSPLLALLFVLLALVPTIRHRMMRTPLATVCMMLATGVVALDFLAAWIYDANIGGSADSLPQQAAETFLGFALKPGKLFGIALLLFVVAQLRAWSLGAPAAAHDAGIDAIAPATAARWRFRFTPSGFRAFFRDRRRILNDVNESAALIEDPAFSPLGFALRGVALAGLPSTMLAIVASVINYFMGSREPFDPDDAMMHTATLALNIVRSYTLPIGLLVASTMAAWAIVGFRSTRTRVTRQLFLMIDAARGLAPLATAALLLNAVGYATPLQLDDGFHELFEALFAQFAAGDDTFPSVAQRPMINGLADASAAAAFLLLWGSLIRLSALRLYEIPMTVAKLAGREAAGSPSGAVLRHAFFIVVLPLLIAFAILGVAMLAMR